MSTLVKNPNVPQDQMLLQLQNGGGGNVITSPVKASLVNGDRQSEDEEEDTEEEVEVEEEEEVSAYETGEDTENDTGTETGLVTRNPIFFGLLLLNERNTVLDPSTVALYFVQTNDYL